MRTKMYTIRGIVIIFFTLLFFNGKANTSSGWPLIMNCPPDVYVSCTDELWNLSCYGNATYTYNGCTYSAGNPSVQYNLNSCNAGTITRTWMVEDYNWNWYSCTQTIYVSSTGSGAPVIYWPADIELNGCNPDINPYHLPDPDNYPTWDYTECNMLGKSYSDMEFYVNSQCRKIMRTWKVMDWCDYSPQYGYKIYTQVQIIYIKNNTPPVVNCPAEITVNAFNCKNAEVTVDPLIVDQSSCGGYFEISNNSPYSYKKGNDISGIYPIGTTKVTYTVKYSCGKSKTCTVNVVVKNASKPTPYCLGYLTTALMPVDADKDGIPEDGMVEVFAKTFDKGSFSSCKNYPLKFSFSKDVNETSRIFTCENVGKNVIQMWVTDSKGAQEFCEVELIIQNNGARIPNCEPKPVDPVDPDPIDTTYHIKGNVLTLTDTPLKDATITARYRDSLYSYIITYDTTETLVLDSFINASGYKLYRYEKKTVITEHKDSTFQILYTSVKTDSLGRYQFDSLTYNKAIEISGSYENDPHKFIDRNDLELLNDFISGKVKFFSYHQFLASDINEDGFINLDDSQILEDFIDGKINKLPGDNQWYLLDQNARYTNPEDVLIQPLPFIIQIDSLNKNLDSINFVAIKKGNISVDPGSLKEDSHVFLRSHLTPSILITTHPNPFVNSLTFDIETNVSQSARLSILNMAGQLVLQSQFELTKGQNNIHVDVDNNITGMFMYQWLIDGHTYNGKLTKIK